MKNLKDELQIIILGDGQTGSGSRLKMAQTFLRRYAETSSPAEKQQRFKDKETAAVITFANGENIFYDYPIPLETFINEGAEQKVYRFDDAHVLKINQGIFYESWLDYLTAY